MTLPDKKTSQDTYTMRHPEPVEGSLVSTQSVGMTNPKMHTN